MKRTEMNQWERELKKDQKENKRIEKFLTKEEQRTAREILKEARERLQQRKARTHLLIQIGGRAEAGMKKTATKVFGFPLTFSDWPQNFIDEVLMTGFDAVMEYALTEKKKSMSPEDIASLKNLSKNKSPSG